MIAAKTWREIRLTTILYVLLLQGLLAIAIFQWPGLRDDTAKLAGLKFLLPADFMRRWVDGVMGDSPYQAYISIQMFFKGINIVGIATACLFGTAVIARERESHTLEGLLSRPWSRSRILFSKFGVLATAIVVPIFLTSWTAIPLSWMIDEELSLTRITMGAAHAAAFCIMFLALTTAFSVRLRSQVDVAFVVGAIIVFQVCIYFIPEVRVLSLFRLSDYDVYWPILAGSSGIAEHRTLQAIWLALAALVLYGLADRLFQRAEL